MTSVWKARERGMLLERVRGVRLVKDAWVAWHRRLHEQKQTEGLLSIILGGIGLHDLCRSCIGVFASFEQLYHILRPF
jgi:hypothetical protein